MEDIRYLPNGQWSLEKTKRYHVEKEKSGISGSTYSIMHPEHGKVGDAVIDHSTGKVDSNIDPKFAHHTEHINRSVLATHVAHSTKADPKLDN